MRKRVLSLTIIITLLGGAFSVSAADATSANGNMPVCCKRARSAGVAAEVSVARLCCKLNCSEPGSGGSTNASNFSSNQGTISATAIIPTPSHLSQIARRNLHARVDYSHASSPRYIQHLALLI